MFVTLTEISNQYNLIFPETYENDEKIIVDIFNGNINKDYEYNIKNIKDF